LRTDVVNVRDFKLIKRSRNVRKISVGTRSSRTNFVTLDRQTREDIDSMRSIDRH